MNIKKTLTLFSIAILGSCLILAFSGARLYTSFTENKVAVQQEIVLASLAKELSDSSSALTKFVRAYAATGNPQAEQAYMAVVAERAGQAPRQAKRLVEPGRKAALTDLMKQYGCTPAELSRVTLANEISNNLIALEREAMNAVKGVFKDSAGKYSIEKEPDLKYARQLVFSEAYEDELEKIQEPISDFFSMLSNRTHTATIEATQAVGTAILFLAFAIGALLLLAIAFAYYARFKICIPLEQTAAYVLQIRNNDLQVTPPSNTSRDEIGILAQGIVSMVHNLVRSIDKAEKATKKAHEAQAAEVAHQQSMLRAAEKIEDIVKVTSSASIELLHKIEQSKAGAEQQAVRISGTAAAMEEMNNSIQEVSQSAGSAAEISASTREKAEAGEIVVKDCVSAISSVESNATLLKNGMDTLTTHAQAISQFIELISHIANQASKLAANATTEVSRAGSAGQGFAVVTEEIRELAEKTMASATNVENTVHAMQQSTATSVTQVEDTVQSVNTATQLVRSCGQALHEIVGLAETTANQVQAIALASKQQTLASEEIAQSMTEISSIADETADAMHEAQDALAELVQQTQQLTHLVTEIKQ